MFNALYASAQHTLLNLPVAAMTGLCFYVSAGLVSEACASIMSRNAGDGVYKPHNVLNMVTGVFGFITLGLFLVLSVLYLVAGHGDEQNPVHIFEQIVGLMDWGTLIVFLILAPFDGARRVFRYGPRID